jgi:hypothetical protein
MIRTPECDAMHSSTFKGFGGTLAPKVYQTTWHQVAEDCKINTHDHEKFIPFTVLTNLCGIFYEENLGIIIILLCQLISNN